LQVIIIIIIIAIIIIIINLDRGGGDRESGRKSRLIQEMNGLSGERRIL